MKKQEKVDIIKWYIKTHCTSRKIQTDAKQTNDIKELEFLIRNNIDIYNLYECSTCSYSDRDYCKKCRERNVSSYGKDECEQKDNYTFPYGYWNKFYLKEQKE